MPLLIALHVFASILLGVPLARADDSRLLSESRRKELAATSFYCQVGRDPMQGSELAWQVRPYAGCKFNGPLDTKINPLKLEAPVLNPLLSLSELKLNLQKLNIAVEQTGGNSIRFRLPSGQDFTANEIAPKAMQDPLFHFNVIPRAWGSVFLSIQAAAPSDIPAFISLAKNFPANSLFWKNPHYQEELAALAHLRSRNTYTALPLLSKCQGGNDWKNFGERRSLLIVGDLHNPAEAEFFRSVLSAKNFSWVGLEMKRDLRLYFDAFIAAASVTEEESALASLLSRFPRDVVDPTKANLRLLKAQKVKVILLDSEDSYTNFPFTSLAFHGLPMSTRNLIWAQQMPANWEGTALMLGGLDHFLDNPGSDFQDYALERFPGTTIGLVNPHEKCF